MLVEYSVIARCRLRMALLSFMVLGLAPCVSAQVVFNVNSTADQLDDNAGTGVFDGVCHTAANTCTLRAAVMEAVRVSGAGATRASRASG